MVIARWPRPSNSPCRRPRGDGRGDTFGIETCAGAHLVGRAVVDDQHAHRAVALRLQDESALEFQRRTQQYSRARSPRRAALRPAPDTGAARELHRLRVRIAQHGHVDRALRPETAEWCRPPEWSKASGSEWRRRRLDHQINPSAEERDGGGRQHGVPISVPAGTRPGCLFAHAAGSRPRRTRPTAARRSPRRSPPRPRCAGRQCMNTASGLARAISAVFTW